MWWVGSQWTCDPRVRSTRSRCASWYRSIRAVHLCPSCSAPYATPSCIARIPRADLHRGSQLASLAPTASRLRSVVLSSSTDAFRPLKNLERCSSPVVNFGADSERSGRGTAAAGE